MGMREPALVGAAMASAITAKPNTQMIFLLIVLSFREGPAKDPAAP